MTRILALVVFVVAAFCVRAQETLTPESIWKLGRVTAAVLSPDGSKVAYVVQRYDLAENKGMTDVFLRAVDGAGAAERLTDDPATESDLAWVDTAAGSRLFFVAKKGEAQAPQVFALDPATKALTQVTDVGGGVANLKVAPTGAIIAYTVDVKLDETVQEIYKDLPKADARIIDSLMYRHWNEWHDYAYSHVVTAPLGADLKAAAGVDLMAGLKTDCPLLPDGGSEQIAWSPHGQEIAFVMKLAKDQAQSTDSNIYLGGSAGEGQKKCLSTGLVGYDLDPVFSPDGRYVAFQSMERNGYESDRKRLMLYDRKAEALRELSAGWDRNATGFVFSKDAKTIFFQSEEVGTDQIFKVDITDEGPGVPVQVTKGDFNWALLGVLPDGSRVLATRTSILRPGELATVAVATGETKLLTEVNDEFMAKLALPTVKARWTRSTDGAMVHSWVVYPPNFDPKKRYPMLTYCQGGPQSQVSQFFSNRWNFHLMAAQGYVVLAINRRGLPGFGVAWNEAISGDWAGQCMDDLLAATDDMLTEGYIDAKRVAAVGASFGGYSVYWLMGHHDGRFAAMIAHCGLFNLPSFYGATEELWFPNFDMGGPYWINENRERYEYFSPHNFVSNWTTPLLVIHGEKDFRVPINQGMEAFTAAQLKGVPSRFLYFPEEGHWISKPQNAVLWQRVFFDWLTRHLK